jgi:hypothetical protein
MGLALIGVLLLALLIPIFAIVVDSPIGRALAGRLQGPDRTLPPGMGELAQKVDLLETEVDDLTRAVDQLREENQFLQRLIEDTPGRAALRPPKAP